MVEKEVAAAILSAVLAAHELENFGALPSEARWSASKEHARLNPEPAVTTVPR